MDEILNESIEAVSFETFVENVADQYLEYCDNIDKYLQEHYLNDEKHIKHYSKNLVEFKKHSKQDIFVYFLKNIFLNANNIVDCNVDFFLTQKPYILKKTKKTKKKVLNAKATHLVPGNMFRYFVFVLNESPKDGKVSKNRDVKMLFHGLTDIIKTFELQLENLQKFIETHFKNENTQQKFRIIIGNFGKIVNDEEEEEEVSSEEEEEEKSGQTSDGNEGESLFSESFIENSTIGKLAKEISGEFDGSDLTGLLSSFQGGADASGNNTIHKIKRKLDDKLKDGTIQLDKIGNEIMYVMKSLTGVTGGDGEGGQVNMMSMFQGMMQGGGSGGGMNFMDLFKNMQGK